MRVLFVAAVAVAALTATPALAGNEEGKVQVKLLGTAVLPDGKITSVDTDVVGLPATLDTRATDNVVPTLAVEYFVSPSISLETICCVTRHDVNASAGLPGGAELVSNATLIPATITAKFHLPAGPVKPYIGAGATYFWWVDVDPGAATVPLGVTRTSLSNEIGGVVQAGADIALGDKGFGLSIDAKRYFVGTTARWYAGNTLAIQTQHKLDPWVLSAGIAFRF